VQVVDEKSKTYVLLEFTGKTKEEVKKLANENYGNKIQVQDSQGRVTEGALSFGTYKEIGMALHYENKAEAEHVAGILRGENSK
jgi:nucleoside-specific outer membrane channel protein Tsx